MPGQAIPYILLLGTLYGTTLIASRFSVGQYEPSTYISIRLGLASLAYLIIARLPSQRAKWPAGRSLWGKTAILALFGTAIPMNFLVASLQYQSSGMTSILITLGPAITVVIAHFFLPEESLTKRKVAGVVIALSGAVLLVLLGETGLPGASESNSIGYLLVFTAMICGSISVVYARKFMSDEDEVQVASLRLYISALIVAPLSLLLVGFDISGVNQQGFFALGWAALTGTFLAMFVSFYVVKRFGATASAMTAYVVPVVASIGGYFILGEKITLGMVGGMGLIVIGIALINQRGSQVSVAAPV